MPAVSAIQAGPVFEGIPFCPRLPQFSEREGIIGQDLGIVADHLEPRNEGYGCQLKEGRIDSVLETLHRSDGELSPENAAGSTRSKKRCRPGLSIPQLRLRVRSKAQLPSRPIFFIVAGPSCPIRPSFQLSHFMSRRSSGVQRIDVVVGRSRHRPPHSPPRATNSCVPGAIRTEHTYAMPTTRPSV